MVLEDAKIILHEALGDPQFGLYRLVLQTEIAHEASPGQFVHIKVSSGLDPLLRRPISIAGIDREKKEITLLYRVKGKGTQHIAEAKVGESLNIMGPLGQGFTVPEEGALHLVAGGIGAFPLLSLAQEALKKGREIRLYWGGESLSFLESAGLRFWEELGINIEVCTMDGSTSIQGTVIDLLKKSDIRGRDKAVAVEEAMNVIGGHVAVCGPHPMMEAVTQYFKGSSYKIEVSLEERMGCGVGACLGCACTLTDGQGKLKRGKVCKDGPVFKAEEVVWYEPGEDAI